jgi:hypothetical protein
MSWSDIIPSPMCMPPPGDADAPQVRSQPVIFWISGPWACSIWRASRSTSGEDALVAACLAMVIAC